MSQVLHQSFLSAAEHHPDRLAVVEPGQGEIRYRDLASLSGRLRERLHGLGVRPGDRVGLYLRKSIDAVAAILGVLEAGAAYVPVDPSAPTARNAYILHDCAVTAVVVESRFEAALVEQLRVLGSAPACLVLDGAGGGAALRDALGEVGSTASGSPALPAAVAPDDLAYILYTSGSTGRPKGVMLSHENAVSFVEWCSQTFGPQPDDRFSSHAPFHFDLSILDLHVALKHGAALVLIAEDVGKDPQRLAPVIAEQRITVWYSAPSILGLLAQYGHLERFDYSALRLVLFAGEVFPVKHLRSLCASLPQPRYFNLYGPTETNVCTFFEVPTPVPPERDVPYPIGKPCSHLRARVVGEDCSPVRAGEEGELCIAGRGVMQGYWALPEHTERAFAVDGSGTLWYRTGDIVVESETGDYVYRGRRDRMVKRRGYRVELGEIEAALYRHPMVKEAAVVALADDEAGVTIRAHLSCREGKRPSLIELKRFCVEQLPVYMVPDRFSWHEALPKTSTDKTDYQRLKELA